MSAEILKSFDKESGLPEDAIRVLSDRRWHEVMSSPRNISMNDTKPWTFWIDSTPKDSPTSTYEDAKGQCYRLEFLHSSWACEGSDLECKGKVIIGTNEMSAKFLLIDNVGYFIS